MLGAMADKTDVSELGSDRTDTDEITRARFAALRDHLLTMAERYASTDSLDQMTAVAVMTTAAAQANHALAVHSINQLEQQKMLEMNQYFQSFIGTLKAMEVSNDERFAQQKEWVERELKARGLPPPQNAKVLSLVPETPPDPAG
jgi:hypothetical protein